MSSLPILVSVGALLTALALAGMLARRVGQSVIPAYILAGVLLGPHSPLGRLAAPLRFASAEYVHALAEVGIVLLLFFMGLHVDFDRLREKGRALALAGLVDLVVTGAAGLAIGLLFGFDAVETLLVAGVVYIASSAIITKALVDRGWITEPEADVVLGILIFEDVVIAVYLTGLTAVALGDGGLVEAGLSLARGVGYLGGLAVVGWVGRDHLGRLVDAETEELLLLRVVGVTTLLAGIASLVGVSDAVTAFFVGVVLGRTALERRLERLVNPVKHVCAAVFFGSLGLGLDPAVLPDIAPMVAVAVAVTVVAVLASGYASGRLSGLSARQSLRVGLALQPRGEFSLVLAALAASTASVSDTVATFAIGYVLVTSLLGTALLDYERSVASLLGLPAEPRTAAAVPGD